MADSESISSGTNKGAKSLVDMVKGVHGIGEQIRGTFNKGVDDLAAEGFGNDTNKNQRFNDAKHEATLKNGENEVRQASNAYNSAK